MHNNKPSIAILVICLLIFTISLDVFASYEGSESNNNSEGITYSSDYGYSLLSDDCKTIYDKLLIACENFDSDIFLSGTCNELDVTYDGIELTNNEKYEIYTYFVYDNPQYFWLDRTVGITDDSISLVCDSRFVTKSAREKAWSTIKATIDNYVNAFNHTEFKNDYEKEKFIHDIIINNTTPCGSSYNPNESYKSNIEGVFGQEKTADSCGYGKAFALLMNATHQKCVSLKCTCKTNHMISVLSAVNIDNKWYWNDVYRDDTEDLPATDYLNFSDAIFKEQYRISFQPSPVAPFSYELPPMSDTKYVLKTAQKPVFVMNLDDSMKINNGEDFTLKVKIENDDNVSYEWYKDNEIIEGQTSDTLIINGAKAENSGIYKVCAICTVGDSSESEFSNECVVNVPSETKIISDLEKSMLAKEGETVILFVSAKGENPLTYQWYKNDILLGNQTQAGIIFTNVSLLDTGNYKVKVTDSASKSVESSVCTLLVIKNEQNDDLSNIDKPLNFDDEQMDNITVPVIKLQNLDTVYEKINSNSKDVIKCADIYYNKEQSGMLKATVEIDTSDISMSQIGSDEKFRSDMTDVLKSLASLNIDKPTRSFELFSQRFDTQNNFKVMTFSKDMQFPFPVDVTFIFNESDNSKDDYCFYYFNDEEKALELCQKSLRMNEDTFKVRLSHCSEYVISPKEINVLEMPYLAVGSDENIQNADSDTQNPNTSQGSKTFITCIFAITSLYIINKHK